MNNGDLITHINTHTVDNLCQYKHSYRDLKQMDNLDHEDKPYQSRQCEKALSHFVNVLNKQLQPLMGDFKGIQLVNPPGENLCYINATVNAFLQCTSVFNLVQSASDCELLTRLRYFVIGREVPKSTESLRAWMISKNWLQFANKQQSDPDEFIRCLFDISESLMDLFNIKSSYTYTCQVCSEVTLRNTDTCSGLQESINGSSIESIIQNNRVSTIERKCNSCQQDTNQIKQETFTSLPDILMAQAKMFSAKVSNQRIVNQNYFLLYFIIHCSSNTNIFTKVFFLNPLHIDFWEHLVRLHLV